jgi:type I restriction enzyme S subunit
VSQSQILSSLPKGWVWTRVGDITEIIRGASPRPKGDPKYFGGNIPWIMISDVSKSEGKFISKTRDTVTDEGAKRSRYLKTGTLILSNSGTVCVPKVLAVDGCIHDGFVAFSNLTKNIEPFYLYHYFNHIRQKVINENRQGVTQVNLNTNIVREIAVPLPPLNEQRRIVGKVEELFSFLDAGVASLRAVLAQLKRYRQAVLKAAFEGKLTEQWRKNNDHQKSPALLLEEIKKERKQISTLKNNAKKYKEAVIPESKGFPPLPPNWAYATADELSSQITDGEHITPPRQEKGVYLLSARNVLDGQLALDDVDFISEKEYERIKKRLNPEQDDVLLSCSGSVGRTCPVPDGIKFSMVRSVALIKPLKKYVSGKFISYALRTTLLQQQVNSKKTQTAQANIFQGKIRTLVFPIAPLPEQLIVVSVIEQYFSATDQAEKTVRNALAYSSVIRQSILREAFKGNIVPQKQSDEPAEKLLERIKAERSSIKSKNSQLELSKYVK